MLKYILITVSVTLIFGVLLGSATKPSKIIKEIHTDTLHIRDTIRIKDTINADDWSDSVRKIVENGDFEINFKKMQAVFIKRTYGEGIFKTVVYYKNENKGLSEQYFICSEKKHKQLVKQFKKEMGP
jgi:hypothetical protein